MANLVYSKCKLDDLLWALGGFEERPEVESKQEMVRRLALKGRSAREIAELIESTKVSVQTMRWRAGVRFHAIQPWTNEETRILFHMRVEGSTFSKIARALKRTPGECQQKYFREQAKKNKRPPLGQAVPKAKVHSTVAA